MVKWNKCQSLDILRHTIFIIENRNYDKKRGSLFQSIYSFLYLLKGTDIYIGNNFYLSPPYINLFITQMNIVGLIVFSFCCSDSHSTRDSLMELIGWKLYGINHVCSKVIRPRIEAR